MVFEGGVEPRVNFFRRGAAGREETQTSEEEEDNMEHYSIQRQKYTRAKGKKYHLAPDRRGAQNAPLFR